MTIPTIRMKDLWFWIDRTTYSSRLVGLCLFLLPTLLLGQGKPIPLTVSLFNESTAIPYTRFFTTPIHPGIQVGTELNYNQREHTRLFQTANLSYFFHNYLAQGIGINTELGYEYKWNFGLALEGLLGVGFMYTLATTEEFSLVNGQYEKKPDHGNGRLYPSLTVGAGYYLKKDDKSSPKIFVRYQAWAEYPYSPDFIPVMTHVSLSVGIKFFIKKSSQTNE